MDDKMALAKRVVDKMYAADEFSKWLGIDKSVSDSAPINVG